eukprot:15485183-Alexandrium_andersonii.AAC.1
MLVLVPVFVSVSLLVWVSVLVRVGACVGVGVRGSGCAGASLHRSLGVPACRRVDVACLRAN